MYRNIFPLSAEEAKKKRKEDKRKGIKKNGSSNNAALFASSLSLEIIYTILNGVVTVIQQSRNAVDIKGNKKKVESY